MRHRWQQSPGPRPSDVHRHVCTACGMVREGFRAVTYQRAGQRFTVAPPCPREMPGKSLEEDAA